MFCPSNNFNRSLRHENDKRSKKELSLQTASLKEFMIFSSRALSLAALRSHNGYVPVKNCWMRHKASEVPPTTILPNTGGVHPNRTQMAQLRTGAEIVVRQMAAE